MLKTIIKRDGSREDFDFDKIERLNEFATRGLNVDLKLLRSQIKFLVYDGMNTQEIFQAQIKAASGLISTENPDFTFVAARYLLADTLKRVTGASQYRHLSECITRGVDAGRYTPELLAIFDLDKLNEALKYENDYLFDYYGLQNVVDRYLMRDNAGKIFELPQHFFMRVAMGVSLKEDNPTQRAIEFYNILSNFDYMSSTPTLFNSGTIHSQLSSCYVNTVNDQISADIEAGEHRYASIFGTIEESARLSKYAGGIGTDWTRVRGEGSHIKSTNGKSSGCVPYLKVYNDTAVGVNQGGRRKGSFAPYMEVWHPDFWDFCELKKEFGDDRLRAHDIFPAAWLADLFMERIEQNGVWSEFQPHLYPELHELHGDAFKARYEELEREGKYHKQRPAVEVWRRILTSLFETGHPWITFKDEFNRRNPQDHVGVIHSSNLCCIAADQRVVTDRGLLTIKELYDLGGDNTVMGLDGPSKAGPMLLPRPNAPMVRIETAEGYSHKVTPDHRVWKKDYGWVEAQFLVPGDELLIQQSPGLFGNIHDPVVAGDLSSLVEERVPDLIWKSDRATVSTYLQTLYNKQKEDLNPSRPDGNVLISSNKEFLEEIQILLANFGIKSAIVYFAENSMWRLVWQNNIPEKGMFATFTGLTQLPNEDAYCLVVDSETHAWTVNGLITHNTEIGLNTSDTETAVCNLGSVNLARHIKNAEIDKDKLQKTVTTAIRMLDNVVDINFYPSDRAKNSNLKHRPIGLGIMGETEAKVACGIRFDTEEGVRFSDEATEWVSYFAFSASCNLVAKEGRRAYASFAGSKLSSGILPIHTARNQDSVIGLDTWNELAESIKTHGIRNSNLMAIAPTATISTIVGTTPCIEPIFEIERSEKNISGQFKVVDPCVKYRRPDLLKTVWEIDSIWVLRSGAARQKWIDQAQSLNIFVKQGMKGRDLAEIYMTAWRLGLKSTYYLRSQTKVKEVPKSLAMATAIEQPPVEEQEMKFCAISDVDCTACQ
jgi:ribonucleotide reductase alpha subunit